MKSVIPSVSGMEAGQKCGTEENYVNSSHRVCKQKGKYSTSSEFKTQVIQENPQMAF